MFKKKVFLTMITVLVLALAACNKPTPKEKLIDGYETLMNANQLESTSTVSMNLEIDGAGPEDQQILQILNDAELTVHAVQDKEAEKTEATIKAHAQMAPFSFDIEIPYHMDLKNQKMYLNADSLIENFAMFAPQITMITDQIKGKLIELDLNDPELNSGLNHVDVNEMNRILSEKLNETLNNKGESSFTENEDLITITFTDEEFKELVMEMALAINQELPESEKMTDQELQDELNTVFENISFNTLTITNTFDGDMIKSQQAEIEITVDLEGQTGTLTLVMDTTYDKINEEVTFTMDPSTAETIPMEELENLVPMGF